MLDREKHQRHQDTAEPEAAKPDASVEIGQQAKEGHGEAPILLFGMHRRAEEVYGE